MHEWTATVGYVRSLRIGSISIACEGKRQGGYRYHHCCTLDRSPFPDDLPLERIERRLVCTFCGAIGKADARPNWNELSQKPLFGPG